MLYRVACMFDDVCQHSFWLEEYLDLDQTFSPTYNKSNKAMILAVIIAISAIA